MDQDFDDLVMECNNCHLGFSAATLHTDSQTNLLMCVNCLSLPGSKINVLKDRPVKKNKVEVKEAPIPTKREEASSDFSLYRCASCRYEFRRKGGFSGSCPYCAKNSVSIGRTN